MKNKYLAFCFTILTICMLFGCMTDGEKKYIKKQTIEEKQILIDSEMEIGPDNGSPWYFFKNGNSLCSWTDEESLSPSHSLKVDLGKEEWGWSSGWIQVLKKNIPYGKLLTFKVFIKSVNVKGNGGFISLCASDKENGICSDMVKEGMRVSTWGNYSIKGNNNWKEYTISFAKPLPNTTKSIIVVIGMGDKSLGTIYFDNAKLTCY